MKNLWKEKVKENWLIKIYPLFSKILPSQKMPNKQIDSSQNPFLKTTIKHWLDNINELGYQFPFCQALISEGHSILHISKHNAFEQGKDVITRDKHGMLCAYQLKGGNITMNSWNSVIKAEIEKLIDLTIIHPSVKHNERHISYLVTNGYLEDTVRLEIDNLNKGKWQNNPLNVITGGQLLKMFMSISTDFIPQDIKNYQVFLDLYFSNGKEFIDEKKFCSFIYDVLKINKDALKKEERKRNISASILYTSYIISSFKKTENHIAIIHCLTLLISYIFALIERYNIPKKYWEESFKVVWQEIIQSGLLLEEEVVTDGKKRSVTSIWDGQIGIFRRHQIMSYLLAIKLSQFINKEDNWDSLKSEKNFYNEFKGEIKVWGEASMFVFFCDFFYHKKLYNNETVKNGLSVVLDGIIKYNGRNGQGVIFSPYYDITSVIRYTYNLLEEPVRENFKNRSFIIKSIIDLMARYDMRESLEKYWREITYIHQETFLPNENWMNFLWRCENEFDGDGQAKTELVKQTQSWKELVDEAKLIDKKKIPKILQELPFALPLFLLVYPHRINSNFIKYLDEITS